MPGEDEATARAWSVVHGAFLEREPVAWPGTRARPLTALAAALALLAAVASAPGRAVLREVREAIGVEQSAPALFSLPAPGRLLVESRIGVWVVQHDGSKRLLRGYREASWSPHGKYIVGAKRNELAALEEDGDVHWTLARRDVHGAAWDGTETDTRVAYLSGRMLRVVAGDGTGDHLLDRPVVAAAWRPRTAGRVLAYVKRRRVVVRNVVTGTVLWRVGVRGARELLWSPDGRRLVVVGRDTLETFERGGRRVSSRGVGRIDAVAFDPDARRLAVAHRVGGGRSEATIVARDLSGGTRAFGGVGRFGELAWSPDGRWLLIAWREADQWVFIRSARVRKLRAASNVTVQFGGGRFPSLAGWCCG